MAVRRPTPRLLPRAASAPRPRRSAVERLEESKAIYVKTGHLRQTRQPALRDRSEPPARPRQLSLHEPSLEDQLRRLLAPDEPPPPASPDDPHYCSLTTSDYVSRSSSTSHRHAAPALLPPPPHKAAVTRSKSDVAHRPSPPPGALFALQKRNSLSSAELEHYPVVLPPPSPAVGAGSPYSSMQTTTTSSSSSTSSGSSLDSDLPPSTSQLSSLDLLRLRAPEPPASIVEKNARVIKWLYGCRRAQEFPESPS